MRVLILDHDQAWYAQGLAAAEPELQLCTALSAGQLPDEAAECTIWLGQPDQAAQLLRRGLRPAWLQSTWAGIAPLLADDLPRDYRLSRAVGVFGQVMAEYLLGYLLAHERRLLARLQSQAERHWDALLPGSLQGRKLLLVGAGEIGRQVAAFLAPFGVEVHGIASHARPQPGFTQMATLDRLAEMAGDCDYLVNLLPDTPATRDLYDAALFACLRADCLFINVGRGVAVVDEDLVAALGAGQLAGAVIDVCREEPLPPQHPFWNAPNLLLTGHTAAPTLPAAMLALFLENLRSYRAGSGLRGEVDFSRGY